MELFEDNYSDIDEVIEDMPDDVEELQNMLMDAHIEIRDLHKKLQSQSNGDPDATNSVADLVTENLELRDELVMCKAAVAEHEFQREMARLRFKQLEDLLAPKQKMSAKFTELASTFSTKITKKIDSLNQSFRSSIKSYRNDEAYMQEKDWTSRQSMASSSLRENESDLDDFDETQSSYADSETDELDGQLEEYLGGDNSYSEVDGLDLKSVRNISYTRKIVRQSTSEPWGMDLDSSVDTNGVWIHSLLGVQHNSAASQGGIHQHEALLAIDGMSLFAANGSMVKSILTKDITEVELTLAPSVDLLVAIGQPTITLL